MSNFSALRRVSAAKVVREIGHPEVAATCAAIELNESYLAVQEGLAAGKKCVAELDGFVRLSGIAATEGITAGLGVAVCHGIISTEDITSRVKRAIETFIAWLKDQFNKLVRYFKAVSFKLKDYNKTLTTLDRKLGAVHTLSTMKVADHYVLATDTKSMTSLIERAKVISSRLATIDKNLYNSNIELLNVVRMNETYDALYDIAKEDPSIVKENNNGHFKFNEAIVAPSTEVSLKSLGYVDTSIIRTHITGALALVDIVTDIVNDQKLFEGYIRDMINELRRPKKTVNGVDDITADDTIPVIGQRIISLNSSTINSVMKLSTAIIQQIVAISDGALLCADPIIDEVRGSK